MKRFYIIVGIIVTVSTFLSFSKVSAQTSVDQTNCGLSSGNIQALGQVSGGSYDVYVILGSDRQTADVGAYYSTYSAGLSASASCQQIASGTASSSKYTKLGKLILPPGPHLATVTLQSLGSGTGSDSTATVVLVPAGFSPCSFGDGCSVAFQGQNMQLLPRKISLSSSKLFLGVIEPLTLGKVSEVIYSVDDKPVYTSNKLSPFNLNYVSNGEHQLQRSVFLESGQILRDERVIKHGSAGQLYYYLVAQYYRFRVIVNVLLIVVILPLVLLLAIITLQARKRRAKWASDHTASVEQNLEEKRLATLMALNAPAKEEGYLQILWHFKWWGIMVGGSLLAVLFYVTSIVTVFTVDGVSMQPTLKNGSKKLLVKAPVSLAKLNRSAYIPDRGTIVVIRHKETNLLTASASQVNAGYVVKRVIALPGERVVIKDGIITVYSVNGIASVPDDTERWLSKTPPSTNYLVDLTLADGELFVVGDNRLQSVDSRSYGPIKSTDIVGKVR